MRIPSSEVRRDGFQNEEIESSLEQIGRIGYVDTLNIDNYTSMFDNRQAALASTCDEKLIAEMG